MKRLLKIRIWCSAIVVIIIAVAVLVLYMKCEGDSVGIYVDERQTNSLTQVIDIREIGQWEFLSIEDEEMVDTVRSGLFSDDYLVRIYYGTLRLGIDMSGVGEDWIVGDEDHVSVTLPPVALLDDKFIDEARTKAFYETGKWNDKARAEMYDKAYQKMMKRCMTGENLQTAQDNARRQFYRMLKAMGFNDIEINFSNAKDG